jgi:hypothetical protein
MNWWLLFTHMVGVWFGAGVGFFTAALMCAQRKG